MRWRLVTGKDRFRDAATRSCFTTGSFWFQAIPIGGGAGDLAQELDAVARRGLDVRRAGMRLARGAPGPGGLRGVTIRQIRGWCLRCCSRTIPR